MIQQRKNMWKDEYYDQFYDQAPCSACHGKRLRPEMLSVTVGNKNIDDFCRMSVVNALDFVNGLEFEGAELKISHEILKEVKARLGFLKNDCHD